MPIIASSGSAVNTSAWVVNNPGVGPVHTSCAVRAGGADPISPPGAGSSVALQDPVGLAAGLRGDGVPAAAASAVGRLGLSYTTYRAASVKPGFLRPGYRVTAYVGGALSEYEPLRAVGSRGRLGGGRRSPISSFTKSSQIRLIKEVNRVRRVALGRALFVTLTYPGDYTQWTVRDTKLHVRALFKRLVRKYGDQAALLWKLEPQKRGAPHYHVCVLGVDRVDRRWLSRVWYEVVGSGDLRHWRAGTQVERVRSHRGALAYLAKYMAKDKHTLSDPAPGRFWGTLGPIERYYGEKIVVELGGRAAADLFRVLDRWRLAEARAASRGRQLECRRRWAIRRARRRRSDDRSRWYVANVEALARYLLWYVGKPPDLPGGVR